MRKLLLILFASVLLAVLSNTAIAQSFTTSSHSGITWARYNIWGSLCTDCQVTNKEDSTGYAPFNASFKAGKTGLNKGTIISTPANHNSIPSPSMAMIAFDTTNKHFYGFNGTNWVMLDSAGGGSPDSSIFLTVSDASATYQPIGTYLTPSDTAAMLTPYLRKIDTTGKWIASGNVFIRPSDTAAMLTNYATDAQVNAKLNITDTTAMLSPYLRKIDTTNKWLPIGTAFITQSDLDDTAAAIRADFPSLTGYVPYTGASSAVDLGIQNLATTGRVSAATLRATNPTSYSDVTSSATSPRSNTLADWDGQIVAATGNGTSGQLLQSNGAAAPTWVTKDPFTYGSGTASTNTSTATAFTITPGASKFFFVRSTYLARNAAGTSVQGGVVVCVGRTDGSGIVTINTPLGTDLSPTGSLGGSGNSVQFTASTTDLNNTVTSGGSTGAVTWWVEIEYFIK